MKRGAFLKRRKSIREKLFFMGILPIVVLALIIFAFGSTVIYSIYSNTVRDGLKADTDVLKGCFDLTVRGDYTYENDILKKGDVNISDSTMLYEIKEKSDVDTTIFWEDVRILTTIENDYGASMVGTQADEVVVKTVIQKGEDYFSKNLVIGANAYIGYYTPLMNEDGKIVGMVFAGKHKEEWKKSMSLVIVAFLVLTLTVVLSALVIWRKFSMSLIRDIDTINLYLRGIATGDFSVRMGEDIVKRDDEISEIGVYAQKMSGELQTMVELDPLTMLYNRRTCNRNIQRLVDDKQAFTIVMLDIDWFKKINDQYGHACGDYILQGVSSIMKDSVQDCGFASRWGGEEFLMVYELDFERTKNKVEALLDTIRNHSFAYEEKQIRITATLGVAQMDEELPYEKVIQMADAKLYEGKKNGRNQVVYDLT